MSTLPQTDLISLAKLERDIKPISLREDEMPSTRSIHGRWSALRVPIDATPDGQVAYGDVSVKISRSQECEDKQPDYSYRLTMMPFNRPSDDEEIDPELERHHRVELEAQRDMYRGDNIDHLTPEGLLVLREHYFAGWRHKNGDDDSDSSERDEDDTDDNDNMTINAADETMNAEIVDQRNEDANSVIADPASFTTVKPAAQAVLHAKLPDEFTYADARPLPVDDQTIPAPESSSEDFEDEIGDARKVLEHTSNLIDNDQSLSVSQFIRRIYSNQKWLHHQTRLIWNRDHLKGPPFPRPRAADRAETAFVDGWKFEDHSIVPEDYDHINQPLFDLQQIDLGNRTGVDERISRNERDALYQHYRGERDSGPVEFLSVAETMKRVRFKPYSMHTKHRASTPHFQLRNHFAVQDHLRYTYSFGSQVWSEYNWSSERINLMDFSSVTQQSAFINPVTISTLALSTDHPRSILMIGGLSGEFAYKSLLGSTDVLKTSTLTTGHITTAPSAVTNHIEIPSHPLRPHHAIISSNDCRIRTLDLTTGYFLHSPSAPTRTGTLTGHAYAFPINCTARCPDGRLHVAIGDHNKPLILRSDNGAIERELPGHSDYGFACAWSPDARYVATAAQDRVVNIYDTRTWRIVSSFSSHVSTPRSMRFSPVGGGARCLLVAEEADRVSVVDGRGFEGGQTFEFHGGVVGVDFEEDGGAFWVANCDARFGGFMRWEREGKGQWERVGFFEEEDGWERGARRTSGRSGLVKERRCLRHGRRWNCCE